MPLPRKTIHDYHKLAHDNGLAYVSGFAPSTVWVNVYWECLTCGREHFKSYHTLKHQLNACRCQNGMSLDVEQYHGLAAELGIEFISELKPYNMFQSVQWRLPNGDVIDASYRDLRYTNRLRNIYIEKGLEDEVAV